MAKVSDVKRVAFEDGSKICVNVPRGTLHIIDNDGDASEVKLDDVAAMQLVAAVLTWVDEGLEGRNALALSEVVESLSGIDLSTENDGGAS